MIQAITDADFNEKTKNGIILIDFWAKWCGPCRVQATILEELAQEIEKVTLFKIDVDDNPETARKFGIMSIPTLLFKKNDQIVKQVTGLHHKEQIQEILATLQDE